MEPYMLYERAEVLTRYDKKCIC